MNSNWKKNIILFITSQTISLFGTSMVGHAIMWYITLETRSGTMMTVYIIFAFLPAFFLAPFAGVWADRYYRKRLIVLSDTLIASFTLILAILFLLGYKEVWLLIIMSAVRGLGQAVQMPAVAAMIPQIVPGDKLMKINGINSSIQSLILLASPAAGGALLTFAAIEVIFFVDVVTAAIAISTMLIFVKVPVHVRAMEKQNTSYFRDMAEGIRYIKAHRFIKGFFLFCALTFFLVAPVAFLTPLQVTRSFGDDVWRLTAIEITFSLGMMAGGILIASWGGFKNKVKTMILSSLIIGVGTISFGVIPIFWLYCVLMAVVGAGMPMMNAPATVLLQQKVEEEFLGRVFGVQSMIASSMMPLGMLVFGPMSDQVVIEWILIGTGFLIILSAIFILARKEMLEAGKS